VRRRLLPLLLAIGCLAPGCRREAAGPGATRYPITGSVVELDAARRTLTLAHEEIPGFMPAMTMPFVVLERDAALLGTTAPGDSVSAVLVVRDSRYWLEELVVTKPRVAVALPEGRAAPREPQPGDPVPDVALVDQDGRSLRTSDYRGRALGLTFVFTRCPLPDFCPFLMRGFARAHEQLLADPALARRTALLTVSFDVEHDTPAVLLEYGRPFQRSRPPFTHWRLATGQRAAIRELGAALGLEFLDEEGSFTHNLRTAAIGPDGRLLRLFRGNDWHPEELVAELTASGGG